MSAFHPLRTFSLRPMLAGMSHRAETTIHIPHGVVFLYDPTMIVDVPPDTGVSPVLSTSDCVSLWTVHEVDGPTTLVLTDSYHDHDCKLVFHGALAARGRKLAFNTSSCEPIIEVEFGSDAPEVTIYADDLKEPSKVVCVAASILA